MRFTCPICGAFLAVGTLFPTSSIVCYQCKQSLSPPTPNASLYVCKKCGLKKSLDVKYIGKQVRCSQCGDINVVDSQHLPGLPDLSPQALAAVLAQQQSRGLPQALAHGAAAPREPGQPAPGQPVPGQTVSGQTVSGQAVPGGHGAESAASQGAKTARERREAERHTLPDVTAYFGMLLGDADLCDISLTGACFFISHPDRDFRVGEVLRPSFFYRGKSMVDGARVVVVRNNIKLIGCRFDFAQPGLERRVRDLVEEALMRQHYLDNAETLTFDDDPRQRLLREHNLF